ncbi:spinster family MFS transporter [Steroidobacter flavus]|uniref:Spinster family MFS transporter n=1 Tax=Steroidobacter flavus TaxID=1842136 RepID=A0ABV8SWD2_9GAMM
MPLKEAAYRPYMLTLLAVILASNGVDRLALSLLLQEIKVDLALSDTQLGLMSGIAFAIFYSLMGIPIARWADKGNRVTIITVTTALWSVAVGLCALAGNFVQLLLIRVGVAVGEAGCIPPAHSLIADHFSRTERPRALSRYMLGGPLSAVFGYLLAGWLNELYGWRLTFLIVGIPGLLLAIVAWFTLREPRRQGMLNAREQASKEWPDAQESSPSLREVFVTLWTIPTFRHLMFSFAAVSFFSYGIGKWKPAFFIRSFGMETGELGAWFTLIYGVGGLLGIYLGGALASRFAARNERLQLKMMALTYAAFAVVSTAMYLVSNVYVAFALMAIATIGGNSVAGPVFATIQTLVPPRMRAMSIALLYLFANLVGLGLGPLGVGMLSDAIAPWAGTESLRYVLLVLSPGYLWGAWHLWRASTTVVRDMEVTYEREMTSSDSAQVEASSNAPRRIPGETVSSSI